MSPLPPVAAGLALGAAADAVLGDPQRCHPVAGFGRVAQWLEGLLYADSRARGSLHTAVCVGLTTGLGLVAQRALRDRPVALGLLVAAGTWTVLGGASLAREGAALADLLEGGDVEAARHRLRSLCARDAQSMSVEDLTRAGVESMAENVSDAVVAPLLWGALAGLPGLLGYRAVNTLDAMVGYRSPRYRAFGWAGARLDDLANVVPARASALILAACAPSVSGGAVAALRAAARDGRSHPSPNAGYPEAAVAGALGVELGGVNEYHGRPERRPVLGAPGRPARVEDLRRAVRMVRAAGTAAAVACVALRVVVERGRIRWRGRGGTT